MLSRIARGRVAAHLELGRAAATTAASRRVPLPSNAPPAALTAFLGKNPYAPQIGYSPSFTTPESNPAKHTFDHAGLIYSLGTDAAIRTVFPDGLAGGENIPLTFERTNINGFLVRPIGVTLVQHLERFRINSARMLPLVGETVLDPPPADWAPLPLNLPPMRGGDSGSSSSTGDEFTASRPSGGPDAAEGGAAPSPVSGRSAARHPLDPDGWHQQPLRLLVGPPGVGKSVILNYAVHYARTNGWLTLFVPDSYWVMSKGLVLVPSKARPGLVDQHDVALRILQEMVKAQGSMLARVPQRGRYATFRYLPPELDKTVTAAREKQRAKEDDERSRQRAIAESTGTKWDAASFASSLDDETLTDIDRSGFTLKDMVDWGIKHPSEATDALIHLIGELREVTEFPVLIAVDALNVLYEDTQYPMKGKLLKGSQLSVPAAFQCVGPDGFKPEFWMKRGVFLGTVCRKHSKKLPMFDENLVAHKYRVSVPTLMREEVHSLMRAYAVSGKFFMLRDPRDVDALAVEYFRLLSSGIPRELFHASAFIQATKGNTHTPGSKDAYKLRNKFS